MVKTGCTCPDRVKRGQTCKHEIAVKHLCDEYHRLKLAAERGERVRPSRHLLQAIRWPTKATGCRECGAATQYDLCANCLLIGRVAA